MWIITAEIHAASASRQSLPLNGDAAAVLIEAVRDFSNNLDTNLPLHLNYTLDLEILPSKVIVKPFVHAG